MWTFLFTDMESSSPAWDLHEAAMAEAQARHDDVLREAVAASTGVVFSTGGDGMGAAFRRVDDALVAAITAQRTFLAERWPEPVVVRVRMGLHTGDAIERDDNFFGPAVIRAARLMSLVEGGRIVCSRAVRDSMDDALPAGVELIPVGSVRLKGLSMPEQVFAVRAPELDEPGTTVVAPSRVAWRAPRPLTRLIGRDDEVESIAARLASDQLLTLTGVGGVGKTRVAAEVARRQLDEFGDGVAWVELAPISQDGDVAQAVADVLHVRPQFDQPLGETICAALVGRRMLVILDNCEHVRDGACELLTAIADRCPELALLTTSRERLGVVGEAAIALTPLRVSGPDPPALELLSDRFDAEVTTAEEIDALEEISARLDGLPLALELAAGLCRSLGPTEVAARLRDHDWSLSDGMRRTERHRSLEDALQWSYRLLDERQRVVLQRISTFASGFDLSAAQQVAADEDLEPADVDESVAALVEKSLVTRRGRRFHLLETTRQFAQLRLAESGQRAAVERRHAAYIASHLRLIRAGLHGPDEATWVEVLDGIWADVRVVVRRAFADDDAEQAIMLVTHLAAEAFWRRPEGLTWIQEAVARFGRSSSPHLHELLGAGGQAAWTQLDVATAVSLAEQALALDPTPGSALDQLPEAAALGAFIYSGQFDRALEVCRSTFERWAATDHGRTGGASPGDDLWNESRMWSNYACALSSAGQIGAEADHAASMAIETAIRTGNPTALGLAYFGHALCVLGTDAAGAARSCEHALAFANQVRNQWLLGVTAAVAAAASMSERDAESSLDLLLATADDLHRTGWTTHAWSVAWSAVPLLFDLGRHQHAALLAGGCHSANVANLGINRLPAAIADLIEGGASNDLSESFRHGRDVPLPDVLRIIESRS